MSIKTKRAVNLDRFIELYNNFEKYDTVDKVAKAMRMKSKAARELAQTLKHQGYTLIDRQKLQLEKTKKKIVETYLDVVHREGRRPVIQEFISKGITSESLKKNFGGLDGLHLHIKKAYPAKVEHLVDSFLFSPKRFRELTNEVKNYSKFVVTTAVVGCEVDRKMLASIKQYCKEKDALLLILIASDPASIASKNSSLDPILKDEYIVYHDLRLNQNLFLSTIKLSAKHIDPLTGLKRLAQKNGSMIFASPKMRLKYVSTRKMQLPKAMMTTGAITKPNYDTKRYMSERTAYLADNDHKMGAILIDLEKNNRHFHFRQIQCDKAGMFYDLGRMYTEEGSKLALEDVIGFRPGDWHSGQTDKDAKACWYDLIKTLKPKKLILDDLFDGLSINHHEKGRKLTKAERARKSQLNLEKEILGVVKDLNEMTSFESIDEVVIVKSNHDEFLNRYLDECRFVEDDENLYYSLDLAKALIDKKDPLRFAIEQTGKLKHPEKILWLNRDEDYVIAGIQNGDHGDKGDNGKFASMQSLEDSYGNCNAAHTHSAEILRDVWRAGTSSHHDLGYNIGASNWTHSGILMYKNGMRQMINVINKKYRV